MVAVMKDNIVKLRKDEKRRGITLVGPHRDDFRFEVSGIDLSLFGSLNPAQGECGCACPVADAVFGPHNRESTVI